jgi:hypothetical protein
MRIARRAARRKVTLETKEEVQIARSFSRRSVVDAGPLQSNDPNTGHAFSE